MPSPRRARYAAIEQPYPGLRPFDLKDSFLFFGREQHTQELLDRLSRNRFLAVVGTSGSGKSSLVRAGLMPALFRGYLVGATSRWRIAIMRPGSAPLDEMAAALAVKEALSANPAEIRAALAASSLGFVSAVRNAQLQPGESLLLVVDQFEEIFRFASERRSRDSTGEAQLFVNSLLEAVDQVEAPIYVVLTMRTDFLGDCTLFPGLPEGLNRSQYLIPRLSREQRREAIERPVEICGAEISGRLVQQILNDMGDDPDQLPVMQHALARMYRMWKQKGSSTPLDLDDYEAAGTVANALDDHAKSIYNALAADAGREWTRKLFRCVTKRERGRDVRRPARLDRLFHVVGADNPASQAAVLGVIEVFAREENSLLFITPGERPEDRIVDISHESLIRKWQQLCGWVQEEAESAEWFSDLVRDTARQARGEADYWVNPELSWVLARKEKDGWNAAWAEQSCRSDAEGLAAVEKFLEGSRAKEARRKLHTRLMYAGVALMVILGLVAADQFHHAQDAQAELARLSAEQQYEKRKILGLEEERDRATGDQRRQLDASINAVKNDLIKSLQQENGELKTKIVGETLNRRISELNDKAQQYDTMKPQYDSMVKQLALFDAIRKERDQLKLEKDPGIRQPAKPGSPAPGNTAIPGTAIPGTVGAANGSSSALAASRTGSPARVPLASPVPVETMAPITVELLNDSAVTVEKAGLTLMVLHMGDLKHEATLLVFSGNPSQLITPYVQKKMAGDLYVSTLVSADWLKACDGSSTVAGGYTVSCFKVDDFKIDKKKGTVQHLGIVTSVGRKLDLSAVDFVWKAGGKQVFDVAIKTAK